MTAIVQHKCVGNEYCEICLEDMPMTKRTGWNGNEASREERQEPIVSANCKFCGEDHSPSVKPMTEQAENEEICLKLLGWRRVKSSGGQKDFYVDEFGNLPPGYCHDAPTFTDWAGRGLIIDALQKQWPMSRPALNDIAEIIRVGAGDETSIRSAALAYLRATE